MKKFRNYGFWTALSGALVLFLGTLGEALGFKIQKEVVSNLVMALAELLVVFGIVVMPKKNTDENSETTKTPDESTEEEKEENKEDDSSQNTENTDNKS